MSGLYPVGFWACHNVGPVHQALDIVGNWMEKAGGTIGHVLTQDLTRALL